MVLGGEVGEGEVTSCGMVGRKGGARSMSLRLPYVPLLGAGLSPNRSAQDRTEVMSVSASVHTHTRTTHDVIKLNDLKVPQV